MSLLLLALSAGAVVHTLERVSLLSAYRLALPLSTRTDRRVLREHRPSDALVFRELDDTGERVDHAILFCTRPSWDSDGLYLIKPVASTTRGTFWNEVRAHFFSHPNHFVQLVDVRDTSFFYAILQEE